MRKKTYRAIITRAVGNNVSVNRGFVPVDRKSVPADQHLRHLLRASRRACGLSQKAAARRAGISPVYWQKIESGTQRTAPAGTLAAMFLATGITAGQLQDEGYKDIASILDELASLTAKPPSPEEHLAATPGATEEEISFLQAAWRVLKAGRTPDPFGPEPPGTRSSR
jgi:transcriptional regulator with XRE-family HTH domain